MIKLKTYTDISIKKKDISYLNYVYLYIKLTSKNK